MAQHELRPWLECFQISPYNNRSLLYQDSNKSASDARVLAAKQTSVRKSGGTRSDSDVKNDEMRFTSENG